MGKTIRDYTDILQSELDKKNLVPVKVTDSIRIYWTDVSIPFVFFKESESGNITLNVQFNTQSKYISGSITRFGKIFCESILLDFSIYDYCNDCNDCNDCN